MTADKKTCKDCGVPHPANRGFFGSTPSGNLRNTCRACVRVASSNYAARNPRAQASRNAARVDRGGHLHLDLDTKQRMWATQRGICACCGSAISDVNAAEVDHATPIARGGGHDVANLFVAHAQCNAEKHNKTLDEHWAWRVRVGLGGTRPKLGK